MTFFITAVILAVRLDPDLLQGSRRGRVGSETEKRGKIAVDSNQDERPRYYLNISQCHWVSSWLLYVRNHFKLVNQVAELPHNLGQFSKLTLEIKGVLPHELRNREV